MSKESYSTLILRPAKATDLEIKMNKSDLELLTESMERVYTFVSDSHDLYSVTRDYGNGDKMNMAEIHTLSLIADNPGISVSGVSKMWNRTLSAASQNINKLAKKNLIEKKKEKGNNRTIHLYVTESGQKLSDIHKAYDQRELTKIAEVLLKIHTFDELKTALKVIETGITIIEKNKIN